MTGHGSDEKIGPMNERGRKIDIVGGAGFVGYSLANCLSKSFKIEILDVKHSRVKCLEDLRDYWNRHYLE